MNFAEADREAVYSFVVYLVQQEFITAAQFHEAFRTMLDIMSDLEADIPRIKSYVAAFAGRAVCQGQMTIVDLADLTENGKHYPFLLLVLQHMGKTMERTKLCKLFDESKVNLMTTLPKTDRSKDRMAEILEERELSFLFPLLKIQAEMAKRLLVSRPSNISSSHYRHCVWRCHRTVFWFKKFLNSNFLKFFRSTPTQLTSLSGLRGKLMLLIKHHMASSMLWWPSFLSSSIMYVIKKLWNYFNQFSKLGVKIREKLQWNCCVWFFRKHWKH